MLTMQTLPIQKAPTRRAFTIPEVAQILGVHKMSVYRHVWAGKLKILATGGRMLIPAGELDRFLGHVVEYSGRE